MSDEASLDLVVIGSALVEITPAEMGRPLSEVEGMSPLPSGSAANFAIALAELGIGPPEITGAALALATQAVPLEALEEDPFSEERIGELLEELVGPLEQHVDELERLASVSGAAAVKRTAEFLAKIGRIAAAGPGTARDRLREVLGVVTPGYGGVKETLRKWCQKEPDFGQRARAKLKDPEKFSEDIRCLQPVF